MTLGLILKLQGSNINHHKRIYRTTHFLREVIPGSTILVFTTHYAMLNNSFSSAHFIPTINLIKVIKKYNTQ